MPVNLNQLVNEAKLEKAIMSTHPRLVPPVQPLRRRPPPHPRLDTAYF